MCIANQYFFAFNSAKYFLVAFLYTEVACIVAGFVVIVVFDVAGIDFTDIAHHICRG